MHLVQDNASPAHTRNDAHLGDSYEIYTEANHKDLNYAPVFIDTQLSSIAITAPKQLWDTDQYQGTAPLSGLNVGLAEYTNANFASDDTIFTESNLADLNPLNNNQYFPFPRRSDTVVFAEPQNQPWNGIDVYRKYFEKNRRAAGEPIQHFAVASRSVRLPAKTDPSPVLQGFDDKCHADYAEKLIPRAVGYSAALLDYFFRGEIDLTPDASGMDAYRIHNLGDERMTGTFYLFRDDAAGNRTQIGEAMVLDIPPHGAVVTTINPPLAVADGHRYLLVFRGRLGSEDGAVVARALANDWREEWDLGLQGRHPWLATGVNLLLENPPGADTLIEVRDGKLLMENRRGAGDGSAQVNHVYIGEPTARSGEVCYFGNDVLNCAFTREFPREINSGTMLRVKLDRSDINQSVPAQSCGSIDWPTGAYQGVFLQFTLADGRRFTLQLAAAGQEGRLWPFETIPLATEYAVNLYALLAKHGAGAVPVRLEWVEVTQHLLDLCSSSSVDHVQRLDVDYLRIEEP